ncbi:hypothetical protein [Paraglaciecola hydrolytica]|uniref:Uncharacterized protein n=1 Tax=Paraglaciecola hydrolytica TaxID=1799789 RepID=A0A136A5W9_9ALTE|nr:hypothetical protein [Paraglaciecola hydrolytica]KXI30623.1 hypothetical protein AX660_04065 [Paraglaciecola hydrolytica]
MTWRVGLVAVSLLTLSGCELIGNRKGADKKVEMTEQAETKDDFCISSVTEIALEENCNMAFWLNYWSDIENKTWPQRKIQIEALGHDSSSILKKILLSQGKATPYQDRLRAQGWIESLLPRLSRPMRNFMSVAIYQPSQELLEMESALVSLSRISTDRSKQNDEYKILIDKQKSQIEQLLKIEASIIDKVNGDKL